MKKVKKGFIINKLFTFMEKYNKIFYILVNYVAFSTIYQQVIAIEVTKENYLTKREVVLPSYHAINEK